jgi:hypothetical protein
MEDSLVTNCQKSEDRRMSSVAAIAKELIGTEMARRSVKRDEARRIVAEKIGVPPGALERLLAGRLVHVERIADRINAYVANRIEHKIAELEHEVFLARHSASGISASDLAAAESAIEQARRALRK